MRRPTEPDAGRSRVAPTFSIQNGLAIPDPGGLARTRRRAIGLVLGLTVAGLALFGWLEGVLGGLSLAAPGEAHCLPVDRDRLLGLAAAAIAVPAISIGLWFFSIARRVFMAAQWPYPGVRLLRPVRVRRGRRARAFALITALLGVLSILGGPAIGVWFHMTVDGLLGETLVVCRHRD